MPRADAKDRQFMMYFPSNADRERWRKIAKKSKMPLTAWIYAMVEARMAEEAATEEAAQKASLQSENRRLRHELQKAEAMISDQQTEIFKLRNQLFALPHYPTAGEFDAALIDLLRSGGTWPNRDILQELGVEPNDADAIDILTHQLRMLQDLRLVKESPRGWRWIG